MEEKPPPCVEVGGKERHFSCLLKLWIGLFLSIRNLVFMENWQHTQLGICILQLPQLCMAVLPSSIQQDYAGDVRLPESLIKGYFSSSLSYQPGTPMWWLESQKPCWVVRWTSEMWRPCTDGGKTGDRGTQGWANCRAAMPSLDFPSLDFFYVKDINFVWAT